MFSLIRCLSFTGGVLSKRPRAIGLTPDVIDEKHGFRRLLMGGAQLVKSSPPSFTDKNDESTPFHTSMGFVRPYAAASPRSSGC